MAKARLEGSDHHTTPTRHKGLDYPFGDRAPEAGETIEVAAGVHWVRLPVPGPLKHINVWLVEEDGGVAIVDTGLPLDACKDAWRSVLDGRRVTRVIVTHLHPDHLGLAGWLTTKFRVRLWMTRAEYLTARLLVADARAEPPTEVIAMWRGAGWSDEQVAAAAARGWGNFAEAVHRLPDGYVRVQGGQQVGRWRAVIGSGHCPEHLCLVDDTQRVMISGDQVLPRISSNVSLTMLEPEGDPLGEWLGSLQRFRAELPADLLVLPAHGAPFTGLHARLDALIESHEKQLERLEGRLREAPRRAVDCFGMMFARAIDDGILGMATGETLAHLRWLERRGRASVEDRDGVWWWSSVS
ncbi:MBL fold metallo-hydrolase [Sphingomonas sp. ID1715]|uniref:MBL fold metallo-hydrolase n=1 Tax=Sphingomonas sp. ID1715 TaxID=1656898 RepID=UPI00148A115B|nr:MBL fold metallo-hydrolase [Sphingomonas sp. ID1715]NNM75850.1 MBL fold metallo-hydrolase [Sphingomonas sp. ID1715]